MNRPAPVEITYKNMRFLITHNPTNATLNKFLEVSFIGFFGVRSCPKICTLSCVDCFEFRVLAFASQESKALPTYPSMKVYACSSFNNRLSFSTITGFSGTLWERC